MPIGKDEATTTETCCWAGVGGGGFDAPFRSGFVDREYDINSHLIDYFGPTVNCAARVESLAYGGQVLVSSGSSRDPVAYASDSCVLICVIDCPILSLSR